VTRPERAAGEPRLGVLLLSAFGLGSSPVMPGTVASLATTALLWVLGSSGLIAFVLGCIVLAIVASRVTLRFGDAVAGADGHGDPGWVVSDEVAGQALACLGAVPWFGDWRYLAAAFVLFRVFDMLKPPPVGTLERLPGARGILYDDVAAGVLAALLTLGLGWTDLLPLGA